MTLASAVLRVDAMASTHRWFAAVLLGLLLLTRGQYALTNAYADWSLCFDDPTTIDLTDINKLTVKTVLYSDPMDEVWRNLLLVMRPAARIVVAGTAPDALGRPEPNGPRAPPPAV
jgi:hypothetical protein